MKALARHIEVLEQFAEQQRVHLDREWSSARVARPLRSPDVLPPPSPVGCHCHNCRARHRLLTRNAYVRVGRALERFFALAGGQP